MATLSAAVMAHPQREEHVHELLGQLGALEFAGPHVPVSWDREGPANNDTEKRWRNGRSAWEMAKLSCDWHMVIQDDAIVSPDLLTGLEKALDHVPPDVIVSPYIGTRRPAPHRWTRLQTRAEQTGASWIVSPVLMWGVAVIVPTRTIVEMTEWADRRAGLPYDLRTGRYYQQKIKTPTWYTWPSLVDHRDGPSLVGHGLQGRNARKFHAGSVLELTWDGPVVYDPQIRSQHRSGPTRRRIRTMTGRDLGEGTCG